MEAKLIEAIIFVAVGLIYLTGLIISFAEWHDNDNIKDP